MTHRYYIAQLPASGGSLELPTAEAHHARTVMRVRCGDRIEVFDGCGRVAEASIDSVSKREITCMAEPPREQILMPDRQVTLGIGLPKGDRAKFLIEKLTEIGVAECIPLECQRSQWSVSSGAMEKWRRAMIEACKQSGRNRLMEIGQPTASLEWFAAPEPSPGLRLLAHPYDSQGQNHDEAAKFAWDSAAMEANQPIQIAVGPEGGFTPEEVSAANAAGWQTVSLGKLVYRIETAAIVIASLAIHR